MEIVEQFTGLTDKDRVKIFEGGYITVNLIENEEYKINSKSGTSIASKVEEPLHESVRKEMDRGRLLFYVTFKGGTAYLDVDNLIHILGIDIKEF